jgi:hypothetical protein
MKLPNLVLLILLEATLLVGCASSISTPESQPTKTLFPTETPQSTPSIVWFPPTATPTVLPTFGLNATQPDEQIYMDPEGWYSVSIPAEWQETDYATSFIGDDGFFETGYLPELMFMSQPLGVCQWLANIETKDQYSVFFIGTQKNSCQLTSHPDIIPATVLEVIENPSAELPHRFLYIKSDLAHFQRIAQTFTWLRPVDENAGPTFHTQTLRPADAEFWENTSPLPVGFSVREYRMPPEAQETNPGQTEFLEFVPDEVRTSLQHSTAFRPPQTLEGVNEILARHGYQLTVGDKTYLYDLFKNRTLVLKNIYRLPKVYLLSTSSSEIFVSIVYTIKDPAQPFYAPDNAASFLLKNETISLWENEPVNSMYDGGNLIWVDNQLLILGLGDHTDLQVRDNQHDLVFAFDTYFGTHIPIEQFQAWDNHWILEVSDFLVQDGEILNSTFGFEEVFHWQLIDQKPFYFFRKGPRVGISYDSQFYSLYYHEIAHGWCCGLAINNPMNDENTIQFFGKRDGVWYYVVVDIN